MMPLVAGSLCNSDFLQGPGLVDSCFTDKAKQCGFWFCKNASVLGVVLALAGMVI